MRLYDDEIVTEVDIHVVIKHKHNIHTSNILSDDRRECKVSI